MMFWYPIAMYRIHSSGRKGPSLGKVCIEQLLVFKTGFGRARNIYSQKSPPLEIHQKSRSSNYSAKGTKPLSIISNH